MLQVIEICIFHINRTYLTQFWELGLSFHLNLSFMYFLWLWLLHINRLFSDFPPNTAFMFKHSNKRKCIIYSPNLPRLCFLRPKLNLSLQKEHLGPKCFSMWQPKRTVKRLLNKNFLKIQLLVYFLSMFTNLQLHTPIVWNGYASNQNLAYNYS
jgi:hypothetical protein